MIIRSFYLHTVTGQRLRCSWYKESKRWIELYVYRLYSCNSNDHVSNDLWQDKCQFKTVRCVEEIKLCMELWMNEKRWTLRRNCYVNKESTNKYWYIGKVTVGYFHWLHPSGFFNVTFKKQDWYLVAIKCTQILPLKWTPNNEFSGLESIDKYCRKIRDNYQKQAHDESGPARAELTAIVIGINAAQLSIRLKIPT